MAQRPGARALSSLIDSARVVGFMGITNIPASIPVSEVWSLREGTVKTYPLLTFAHDKTINRDANGRIATLTIIDGVNTKTFAFTRDVNGRITAVDESWV